MTNNEIAEILIRQIADIADIIDIKFIEMVYVEGDSGHSLAKKSLSEDFPYMSYETLIKIPDFTEKLKGGEEFSLELTSKYSKKINCFVSISKVENYARWAVVTQGEKAITDISKRLLSFIAKTLSDLSVYANREVFQRSESKKELLNMRDIQARLFPKFDDVKEMDIRSAYLPAKFMSGAFIDGFFNDKNTYTVATCYIANEGHSSSFIGGMIKTMLRSDELIKNVPSVIIDKINNKLKNSIPGNIADIYLSIYQINLKTAKVSISSFGKIHSLLYINNKNGVINLSETETGKLFTNRSFFRDLTISMEEGDILLYYTPGILRAKKENTNTEFGLERLKGKFKENANLDSLEIVHSIIESVYDFTDYAELDEDIILVAMKRK
ncbi:MAG TPA: SpoIIE family protein phosphatase [Spirochaetota bacterium]|nr:SpoIIE family protein phosphatase [Spirochaetota bacterium]